ncbi:MAG TPA: hypothetical protein PKL15_18335 [Saprospiraceae bacterium]|nr:hypothetical protein [Saprospiraceae bacterium]
MKHALLLLFAFVAFFSCTKKECDCVPPPGQVDYLIIGYSSCFCVDCCTTGYKLTDGKIYLGERTEPDKYTFQTTALDQAKYDQTKVLIDEFPTQLLGENNAFYGCGGCADQPVYYVEMKKNGQVYSWHIDSVTNGFPDYVKEYAQKLSDAFGKLQ